MEVHERSGGLKEHLGFMKGTKVHKRDGGPWEGWGLMRRMKVHETTIGS